MTNKQMTFKEVVEALMSGKVVKFDDILYKLAEKGNLKYWCSDEWIDSHKFFAYCNDGAICPDPSIQAHAAAPPKPLPEDMIDELNAKLFNSGHTCLGVYEILALMNEKINKLGKGE